VPQHLPKKDFTSIDLQAVVAELKEKLADSRVNNIYQLDAKTLLLKLHKANMPPMRLILEAGRRLHFTNYSLEKPQMPPAFCMTLRKYLPGAWISRVEQHEFERIAIFHFRTSESTLQLILELFGEGNIILTDEKGQILQAMFFKRMRDRNIVRGESYQYPPSMGKNPFKVTRQQLEEGLKPAGETDVVRAIVRFLGLGGVYSEELLQRAAIDKTKKCSILTDTDFDAIFNSLQGLLSAVSGKTDPVIILDDADGFMDVVPLKLKRYEKCKVQSFSSFSDALDEFYARVITAEKAVAGINVDQHKREAERLKRMVVEQEQALKEGERKMQRDKLVGDAIYAHFAELQTLLEKFSSAWREGKNLTAVVAEVSAAKKAGQQYAQYYESFDSRNLAVIVRIDDSSLSLNLKNSLYDNAAEFYDRGKREKQKMPGISTALGESRKKLTEIEKQLNRVEALKTAAPAEALEDLANRRVETKEWFEKFRWFKSSDGFLIVAGKDAVSNEVLIKKYTDPYDLVFHADIVGSPFAVVKTAGKLPEEQTLKETAELAAAYSRGWREGMGAVDVYWVKPDQLSKTGPSGEFVPHGAFMVLGKRNWMRGTPLRLAVGVILGETPVFVGGPVDAVKKQTKTYVVIVPGDNTGKEFLKQILRSLTLKLPKDQREKIGKSSIESVREFVPYAKARLVSND
jgi:predicted ribosome quality control (RQC) complex YloA/Tae2 family protein